MKAYAHCMASPIQFIRYVNYTTAENDPTAGRAVPFSHPSGLIEIGHLHTRHPTARIEYLADETLSGGLTRLHLQ